MSGAAVENVGMDVCVKFGYSRSNGLRDIRGAVFVSFKMAAILNMFLSITQGI